VSEEGTNAVGQCDDDVDGVGGDGGGDGEDASAAVVAAAAAAAAAEPTRNGEAFSRFRGIL